MWALQCSIGLLYLRSHHTSEGESICFGLGMTINNCVVLSYASIIKTIFRFPSVQQRKKAFSTCSSHMIVVSITYGSCIFIYMNPTAKEEVTINKVVSLLISSISPTLNPFIYTLRNNQVKKAFKDAMKRTAILSAKENKIFQKHIKNISK